MLLCPMDARTPKGDAAPIAMRPAILLALALALLPACRRADPPRPITPTPTHREPAPPLSEPIATTDPTPVTTPKPTTPPGECDPYRDLEDRRGGDLLVPARPSPPERPLAGGRLRTHTDGALNAGAPRMWVVDPVPAFVPLTEGPAELFILDRVGDTFVATYRAPYGTGSCALDDGATNCDFHVKAFDKCGAPQWAIHLNDFMSRRDHLEMQDIRYDPDTAALYFNEACQSYSREAGGKCSALVAVDPKAGKLLWRTPPLRSNHEFMLYKGYVVSIYSFSQEKSFVHVIRKQDGKVLLRKAIEKANWDLQIHPDGHLQTAAFGPRSIHYTMTGWDEGKPALTLAHD